MRRITKWRPSVLRLEGRDAPSVTPVGGNFAVNAATTGLQSEPAVAMDADGDFIVAWQSTFGFDFSGYGIYSRRYAPDGTPLESFDTLVNFFTTGNQTAPAVAMDAAGDAVVVWQSAGEDGSGEGVFGQRYDSAGNRAGVPFDVNTFTTGDQGVPAVAMSPGGDFVVVWQSNGQDGNSWGVYGRRFSAAGLAQGGEFRVNTTTANGQFESSVAMDYAGNFVVAWTSVGQDGSGDGVYAQRYDAAGTPQGGELHVGTVTANDQDQPSVGMDAAGNFAVSWESFEQIPSSGNAFVIHVQQYTAAGVATGTDFVTSGTGATPDNFVSPTLAHRPDSGILYAFEEAASPDTYIQVQNINPQSISLTANLPYLTGTHSAPAIATDSAGDFVVVWQGQGSGDDFGIFGQRYDESTDKAAPLVTGVYTPLSDTPLAEAGRLLAPVSSLTVDFSEDMDQTGGSTGANSVTNPANWLLTREGNDITSEVTGITYGFDSTTRQYKAMLNLAAPLTDQRIYALVPGANLRDHAGNVLDGDYDGVAGGQLRRDFRVAVPGTVGGELQVNTTTGPTFSLANTVTAAADAAGDYVVAWRGGPLAPLSGVRAQVYTAAGAPRGPELLVSANGTSRVSVAMDPAGDFVVVYARGNAADGSSYGVYAQRFAVTGTPLGSEFLVNQTTTGAQDDATVAVDAAGDMVFTWETPGSVPTSTRIAARQFNADGTPRGNEFFVDFATSGHNITPAVAADAAGDFVVVYDDDDDSLHELFWSSYLANGRGFFGLQESVAGPVTQPRSQPSVAMDAGGHFVVAWTHALTAGSPDILLQQWDVNGMDTYGPFGISQFTTGTRQGASVSVDAAGDCVVAWESSGEEASGFGVYARRFSTNGTSLGSEIHVNTFTTGDQRFPTTAMDGDGDFVVAWESLQGGNGSDVFAQRYTVAPPRVTAVQVNNTIADPQRSRVTAIRLVFNSRVAYAGNPVAAFTLTRQSDGVPVTFGVTNVGTNNGVSVISLTNFSGPATDNGSLADGRYTLRVLASQVSNLGGALDGDGDSIGGDDYVLMGTPANGLFRLFGDNDGNGTVNSADFLAFRSAFGGNSFAFDFNNSGSVDASDFLAFRLRFGSSV